MKKLIKMFLCVLVIAIVIIPSTIIASAAQTRVIDDAKLFSATEKASLEKQISKMQAKYNQDFVIVTTKDTKGKNAQNYADDYYDNNGYGIGSNKSGSLFLIDMGNRKFHISTTGKTINSFTNKNRDKTLTKVTSEMKSADYYGAAQVYLNDMSKYIDSSKKKLTPFEAGIALLISLAVGGIFIAVIRYKYSFAGPQCAYPLKENSTLNLNVNEDTFLNKTVTSVIIQSSNSSGGGSSTHSSSSGSSHGGGGGSF